MSDDERRGLVEECRAYDEMLTRAEGQGGLFSIARRLRELTEASGRLAPASRTAEA